MGVRRQQLECDKCGLPPACTAFIPRFWPCTTPYTLAAGFSLQRPDGSGLDEHNTECGAEADGVWPGLAQLKCVPNQTVMEGWAPLGAPGRSCLDWCAMYGLAHDVSKGLLHGAQHQAQLMADLNGPSLSIMLWFVQTCAHVLQLRNPY